MSKRKNTSKNIVESLIEPNSNKLIETDEVQPTVLPFSRRKRFRLDDPIVKRFRDKYYKALDRFMPILEVLPNITSTLLQLNESENFKRLNVKILKISPANVRQLVITITQKSNPEITRLVMQAMDSTEDEDFVFIEQLGSSTPVYDATKDGTRRPTCSLR